MKKNLLMCLALLTVGCSSSQSDFQSPQEIERLAFGSCCKPRNYLENMFSAIEKRQPDLFLMLGDNIYGDTEDMNLLKEKYQELAETPGFASLRRSCPLLAIWDDHDYGVNDGGRHYPKKRQSEQIFLDFFEPGQRSPRSRRPGLYTSHLYGPVGRRIQIIVLDCRYFRDELPKTEWDHTKDYDGWYEATMNPELTLLGERQWQWLDRQLAVPADVRIIASSIQLLAHEKGMENWGHYPHERQRLFELLKKHQVKNTLALSGDVHFAEISKRYIGSYPLYDFTSSGLTHTSKSWPLAKNHYRVGNAVHELNAGIIDIDWEARRFFLRIIDKESKDAEVHEIPFDQLQFNKSEPPP